MKILRALKFKCKRATNLLFRAAYYDQFSTPQLLWSSLSLSLSLSPLRPQNLTWENSLPTICWALFFLFSPIFCTLFFIFLGSLVSFYNHLSLLLFLHWNTGTVSVQRLGWWGQHLIKKLASVSCAARTGLVPQHLTKIIRWLSSGLWKIGLERLALDKK